MKKVFEICNM